MLLAHGDCEHCPVISGSNQFLTARVEQLNNLLRSRHLLPIQLLSHSTTVWEKIYAQEELISKGTLLRRRDFLSPASSTQNVQQQMVVIDPLNRRESQTIPPAALLPDVIEKSACIWVWAPQIVENLCTGCDACIRLCPTNALQLDTDSSDTPAYLIKEKLCTGCHICSDVCTENACQVTTWETASKNFIPLVEKQCTQCGNPYHLPTSNPLVTESLCPICSSKSRDSHEGSK